MTTQPHVTICLCTYRRPDLLDKLLSRLEHQDTRDLFDYSIVVVDNDRMESARAVVEAWAGRSARSVRYFVEPEQNIALARNMSVAHATGDLVAFIDDDEDPIDEWLVTLYQTLVEYDVEGILGPVRPRFEATPPRWAVKSRVFERPEFETGHKIDWRVTGTGNVLMRRSVVAGMEEPFGRQFASGGEDVDFFRRAMAGGNVFLWCDDAVVYETVPAERTLLSFQLRRALLRGKVSRPGPAGEWPGILKSVTACGVYTMMLPVFLLMGWHIFVKYLIKDFDHLGKLMAACGLDVGGEKYILK
jgi:succinoglycan biosynthesis protein ExoM